MTLLLAVIITTAVLSIALGIYSLLFGQLKLGQSARESGVAFFSADAGKECALYYLWRAPTPSGESFWSSADPCGGAASGTCKVECYGALFPVTYTPANGAVTDEYIYTFRAQRNPIGGDGSPYWDRANGVCADVEVRSKIFACTEASYRRTVIESHGYSYCSGAVSGGVNRTLQIVDRGGETKLKCPADTL